MNTMAPLPQNERLEPAMESTERIEPDMDEPDMESDATAKQLPHDDKTATITTTSSTAATPRDGRRSKSPIMKPAMKRNSLPSDMETTMMQRRQTHHPSQRDTHRMSRRDSTEIKHDILRSISSSAGYPNGSVPVPSAAAAAGAKSFTSPRRSSYHVDAVKTYQEHLQQLEHVPNLVIDRFEPIRSSSSNTSSNSASSSSSHKLKRKQPSFRQSLASISFASQQQHHHQQQQEEDSKLLKQSQLHSIQALNNATLNNNHHTINQHPDSNDHIVLSAVDKLRVQEDPAARQSIWRRLAIQASSHSEETTQKELILRSTFILMSGMTTLAGIIWAGMYVALEEYAAACMPVIYSTVMSSVLFTCICNARGRYDLFVACQLTMILILPFAVHVVLGGVNDSGGVMLWSFLCPMGAAFFRSAKESLPWFYVFMAGSVLLLLVEFIWTTRSSSETNVIQLYFMMNILGVKAVVFSAVFIFAQDSEQEYTKSEEVLLNILPASIVKRIKRGEFPFVDNVPGVSILFADLVGFTKASTELHPNFLIGLFLRDIFHAFDELTNKYGLEKIKTIGGAYMVVGGLNHDDSSSSSSSSPLSSSSSPSSLPLSSPDKNKPQQQHHKEHHTTQTMLLARDMFRELKRINQKYNLQFQLMVGVHTGPVVAGVLGLKRITYDVWGDSVNTASRMESNGVPSHIHLSSDMYNAVANMNDIFEFKCCGSIEIKGKGDMTTFLAKPLE